MSGNSLLSRCRRDPPGLSFYPGHPGRITGKVHPSQAVEFTGLVHSAFHYPGFGNIEIVLSTAGIELNRPLEYGNRVIRLVSIEKHLALFGELQ